VNLADPTLPTGSTTSWLTNHGGLIIGAIVCAIILVALWRSIPKWLIALLLAFVGLMYLGVKFR
jgi:hypothetical protein